MQAPLPDKKFEGRSNLKGAAESQERKQKRGQDANDRAMNSIDYIENLQKQVGIMESQIKMLKDREVDQKNKASGYETFLRDQIPLNEHFLSLKNKYNNEKDALDKAREALEEEVQHRIDRNEQKRRGIEIQKQDYATILRKFESRKDEFAHLLRK